MAAIETFMNQRMYDEAVTDMKNDLDRRHMVVEESSDSDTPTHQKEMRKPRSNKWTAPGVENEEVPAYTTAHRHRLRRKQGMHGKKAKGANKVSTWLSQQDFGRAFSFHQTVQQAGASKTGEGGYPAPTYTRHQVARLSKGTLWDRSMSALGWINKSLPIYNPNSTGRRAWEIFIMILVLYNAVAVPIDVSFEMPTKDNIVNYVEYGVDLIYAIDICATFRTAYVDNQGHVERDTTKIAKRYLKFWFWVDVFATIPYDLLARAIVGSGNSEQLTVLGFLRTPRLLRLGRLVRLLDRLKSANALRVFILIAAMAMLAHWLACIWYMFYKYTTFADYTEWGIFLDGVIPEDAKLAAYISAYYQSFLLLVGDNQASSNNLERIFFIVILILGACFYSAVVGQMAVLVANMNTVGLRHRSKQDQTMDVLRYCGVPTDVTQRVQGYFQYITQYSHPGIEGLAFLSDLPKALHEDLASFLHRKALSKVPIFAGLEPAFLSCVAERMRIVTFTPAETIFRAGDLGLEMYTIRKGCVAVVGKHSQLMSVLGPGEYFGEIALFTQAKRTAKCVALSNCDLCVLNAYDLKMVMKDFPTSASTLEANAQEKLRQLQVAGRAGFIAEEDDEEEDFYGQDEPDEEAEEAHEEVVESYFTTGSVDKGSGSADGGSSSDGGQRGSADGQRNSAGAAGPGSGDARAAASLPASPSPTHEVGWPSISGADHGATHQPLPPDPRISPYTSASPAAAAAAGGSGAGAAGPSPPGPGPVGEGTEIEPADNSPGPSPRHIRRMHAAPTAQATAHSQQVRDGAASPVGEAREQASTSQPVVSGDTAFDLGMAGAAGTSDLAHALLSPPSGSRSRQIMRQSPQQPGAAAPNRHTMGGPGEAAAAMQMAGASGVFKSVDPMAAPLSPERTRAPKGGSGKLVRQGSTASSTGRNWVPDNDDVGMGDGGMHWMRATVTARGAKVMSTGQGHEGAPHTPKRQSGPGSPVDTGSGVHATARGPGPHHTSRRNSTEPQLSSRRSRRGSAEPTIPATGSVPDLQVTARHASATAQHSSGRHKLGSGPHVPNGLSPSPEPPPVLSRNTMRKSRASDTMDENNMLSPKGAIGQNSTPHTPGRGGLGQQSRRIRRASAVVPGMLVSQLHATNSAGSGAGDAMALVAAEGEITRLKQELREARAELDSDRKLKADLFGRVHGLAVVVEQLAVAVTALEGRMDGLEGQMAHLEVSQRAARGGGGGIFGIVSENETSHARKDLNQDNSLSHQGSSNLGMQRQGTSRAKSVADMSTSRGGSIVKAAVKAATVASPEPGTLNLREQSKANMTRLKRAVKRDQSRTNLAASVANSGSQVEVPGLQQAGASTPRKSS